MAYDNPCTFGIGQIVVGIDIRYLVFNKILGLIHFANVVV